MNPKARIHSLKMKEKMKKSTIPILFLVASLQLTYVP